MIFDEHKTQNGCFNWKGTWATEWLCCDDHWAWIDYQTWSYCQICGSECMQAANPHACIELPSPSNMQRELMVEDSKTNTRMQLKDSTCFYFKGHMTNKGFTVRPWLTYCAVHQFHRNQGCLLEKESPLLSEIKILHFLMNHLVTQKQTKMRDMFLSFALVCVTVTWTQWWMVSNR